MTARSSRELRFTVQATPPGQLFHFKVQKAGASFSASNPAAVPMLTADKSRLLAGVTPMQLGGAYVTGFIAEYASLAGNLPQTYENSIALWYSTVPNLQAGPLVQVSVTGNTQNGNVFLPWPIQQTDYCITYQTGPNVLQMCALASVPVGAPLPDPVWISLRIVSLTTDVLKIFYATVPGSAPVQAGGWIGLYVGSAVPYATGAPPLVQAPITSPQPQGVVSLAWQADYADYMNFIVVYGSGPGITRAAAAITFQINPS